MIIPSSFRDPSGFVFLYAGSIFRQINMNYKDDFDFFINSKLYDALISKNLLVSHHEVPIEYAKSSGAYKVIKPEFIPFISYPYEWCFSQLKDAALLTLEIQNIALNHGMILKDCSSYNIQFKDGKPIFIDTLSFERYSEGKPWDAYRQFCQHFLAPLALMFYKDIRLNQLLKIYLDGIPLDLASRLLPKRTYLNLTILSHIHLHSKSQIRFADKSIDTKKHKVSLLALYGIVDNLKSFINKLNLKFIKTEWADYYGNTNYSNSGFNQKKKIVSDFLDIIKPKMVWDLGANTGEFSKLSREKNIQTISFDIDPICAEKNYLEHVKGKKIDILPLVLDLTNPSPGIGWDNTERMSFRERSSPDTIIALALIHHLAISNNLPLYKIADFFSKNCKSLIIEFVPKTDSKVKKLLSTRKDIFFDYEQGNFIKAFEQFFRIIKSQKIDNSERILYLMERK